MVMLVGDRRRTPMKQLADPLVKDSAVLENLVRLLIWTPFCRIQREDLQEEDRRAKGKKERGGSNDWRRDKGCTNRTN